MKDRAEKFSVFFIGQKTESLKKKTFIFWACLATCAAGTGTLRLFLWWFCLVADASMLTLLLRSALRGMEISSAGYHLFFLHLSPDFLLLRRQVTSTRRVLEYFTPPTSALTLLVERTLLQQSSGLSMLLWIILFPVTSLATCQARVVPLLICKEASIAYRRHYGYNNMQVA